MPYGTYTGPFATQNRPYIIYNTHMKKIPAVVRKHFVGWLASEMQTYYELPTVGQGPSAGPGEGLFARPPPPQSGLGPPAGPGEGGVRRGS